MRGEKLKLVWTPDWMSLGAEVWTGWGRDGDIVCVGAERAYHAESKELQSVS